MAKHVIELSDRVGMQQSVVQECQLQMLNMKKVVLDFVDRDTEALDGFVQDGKKIDHIASIVAQILERLMDA